MSATKNDRIGSSFDDILEDEGDWGETSAVAIRRVLAWQLKKAMANEGLTRDAMASRMRTNRNQLDAALDPANDRIELDTLFKAARVLGHEIKLQFV